MCREDKILSAGKKTFYFFKSFQYNLVRFCNPISEQCLNIMKTKKTILVVDDEEQLCQTVAGELRREQYDVSEAYDGETAIACINEHLPLSFDVVILDITMPGIDGLHVLDYLKKNHPSTKVIMVTGHSDFKSAIEAVKRGADEFITKPYEFDTLFEAINKVLREEEE